MTEPRDYTTWTAADHLDAAVTLAAEADELASADVAESVAARRREHIRHTTARGLLHVQIAAEKARSTPPQLLVAQRMPEPEQVPVEPVAEEPPVAEAPKPRARTQRRNGGA
jgi:hypothetical protein